jgi:hypothetical protein
MCESALMFAFMALGREILEVAGFDIAQSAHLALERGKC